MNFEYLVNAFAKNSRDIFKSQNVEEYNLLIRNVQILYNEIYNRIGDFLISKMDDERWIENETRRD